MKEKKVCDTEQFWLYFEFAYVNCTRLTNFTHSRTIFVYKSARIRSILSSMPVDIESVVQFPPKYNLSLCGDFLFRLWENRWNKEKPYATLRHMHWQTNQTEIQNKQSSTVKNPFKIDARRQERERERVKKDQLFFSFTFGYVSKFKHM